LRLRRVDIDPVGHAGLAIKPVFLIDLLAAGGGHEHVVAEVRLVQVHAERKLTVGFGEQGRHAHRLLNHHVAGAGDLSQLAGQFTGEIMVGIEIRAVNLHVDRRKRAKVQNPRGKIGRLECEFGPRIAL
jgi:hypothetical protein